MSSPSLELLFCELEIGRSASLVLSRPKAGWTEPSVRMSPGRALRGWAGAQRLLSS